MDRYQETFETWNKVAKLYEDVFMHLDLYNDTYDIFCELITKENAHVLEIGCGPGNITRYLLEKKPDLLINGIDISPNMISLAEKNNPSANFKVMDCRNIDQLTNKVDAIMCGFCLPYLSETDNLKFLMDCSKLLLQEGTIYLSFVEGEYSLSGYQTGSSGDRTYFYYHSVEDIISELNANNIKLIQLFKKDYVKRDGSAEIHSILIARKD